MTVPPEPHYAIISNDVFDGVRAGATVTYSLVRTNIVTATSSPHGNADPVSIAASEAELERTYPAPHPYSHDLVLAPRIRFSIQNERAFDLRRTAEPFRFKPTRSGYTVQIKWLTPGHHKLLCFIDPAPAWDDGRKRVIEYQQWVMTDEESEAAFNRFLSTNYLAELFTGRAHPEKYERLRTDMCRPEVVAHQLSRTALVLAQIEQRFPTTDGAAQERHRRRLREIETQANRLATMVAGINKLAAERHPIEAFHNAPTDVVPLRLFCVISRERVPVRGPRPPGATQTPTVPGKVVEQYAAVIVDWTDPNTVAYSGAYYGVDEDKATALQRALRHWKTRNRYPEGKVQYTLHPPLSDLLTHDTFLVDDFVSDGIGFALTQLSLPLVLDSVALATSLTALALTFSPLPGGRVVGVLLWASIASGAAASTLRIVSRRMDGRNDIVADAIDGLQIVSSLLAIPGATMAWRAGANVAIRNVPILRPERLIEYTLIGQLVSDGLQGVLIAASDLDKISKLLADGRLEPEERLGQIMGLLGNLATVFTVTAVSLRGNAKQLSDLPALRDELGKLLTSGTTLDIDGLPRVRGHTRDGPHTTRVDVDPPSTRAPIAIEPVLTPEARQSLGLGPSDPIPEPARRMMRLDPDGADRLIARHGNRALSVADEFESLWNRARELGAPPETVRIYHKHTGIDGVTYLARQPRTRAGALEFHTGLTACFLEEHYKNLFHHAGHSVAYHGPHISEDALKDRVRTGIAPDGMPSPQKRSSQFNSFQEWLAAHDAVFAELEQQFGMVAAPGPGDARGPIVVDGIVNDSGDLLPHAKVRGIFLARLIEDPLIEDYRTIGRGVVGVSDALKRDETFLRPDGSTTVRPVYPTVVVDDALRAFTATVGWTGNEWVIVQLFPVAPPVNPTLLKFQPSKVMLGDGLVSDVIR